MSIPPSSCPDPSRPTYPLRAQHYRKLSEYEELVSDLLSSRFVHLAVTIPLSTSAGGVGGDDGGDGDANGDPRPDGEIDLSRDFVDPLGRVDWTAAEGLGGSSSTSNGGGESEEGREGREREEIRRDLQLIVRGLLRLGEMERVLGVVQERVSEDLKLIIR